MENPTQVLGAGMGKVRKKACAQKSANLRRISQGIVQQNFTTHFWRIGTTIPWPKTDNKTGIQG